jgi:hypothetical protein
MVAVLALGTLGAAQAALVAPTLLAPANGVTVEPPVTLQWNAVAGATGYGVQMALDSAFTKGLVFRATTETKLVLQQLPLNVTIWWRVGAKNTERSPWSEAWSFKTPAPPPLTAPTLLQPANGATVTLPVTLEWSKVEDAGGYVVQMANDSAFASVRVSRWVWATQLLVRDLPRGVTVWWRVKAVRPGAEGPWSNVWSFKTPAPPPLTAPTLLQPADGSTVALPVTLKWSKVEGAAAYVVQMAKDKTFSAVGATRWVPATELVLGDLPRGVTVWWRVKAVRPGAEGPWSNVWSFNTPVLAPPPTLEAPVLTAPANGSTVSAPVMMQWQAVAGAKAYQVQVAKNNAFGVPAGGGMTPGTSLTWNGALAGTYYWRVRAVAGSAPPSGATTQCEGIVGPWSEVWSFTVQGTTPPPPSLGAPILTAPANGATDVSTAPLLDWEGVEGAAGYLVQVATNSTFQNLVFAGPTTATEEQLTGLPQGTTVYWRARAYAGGAQGPWSEVWSFTTVSGTR